MEVSGKKRRQRGRTAWEVKFEFFKRPPIFSSNLLKVPRTLNGMKWILDKKSGAIMRKRVVFFLPKTPGHFVDASLYISVKGAGAGLINSSQKSNPTQVQI